MSGQSDDEVRLFLADTHGLAVTDTFAKRDAPEALLDARGKLILTDGAEAILGQIDASVTDVAEAMEPDAIPEGIRTFIEELIRLS